MYYELLDGKRGDIDEIFISNSQSIKNMLESCEKTDIIPLLHECFTEQSIRDTTNILKYLLRGEIFEDQDYLMSEDGLDRLVDVLNLSDYCDMLILRHFLVEYISKYIRRHHSLGDLEFLFNEK